VNRARRGNIAAGALYGLTTLAPFVLPVWRQMDRRPAPRERAHATVTGNG
jgi:hypothetical protein